MAACGRQLSSLVYEAFGPSGSPKRAAQERVEKGTVQSHVARADTHRHENRQRTAIFKRAMLKLHRRGAEDAENAQRKTSDSSLIRIALRLLYQGT